MDFHLACLIATLCSTVFLNAKSGNVQNVEMPNLLLCDFLFLQNVSPSF